MRFPCLALALVACSSGAPAPHQNLPSSGAGGAGAAGASAASDGGSESDDPEPSISDEDWQRLRELSPKALPAPPADATNAWADDEAAAQFGQELFFDARFSGALLDGDNDGSQNALGTRGDTGKVSCAGCHLPESGFSDTRSLHQEVSLAAGWLLRRTPSLLDVAQSKIMMWDGRRDSFFSQAFGPLESPLEMNSSRLFAAQQVFANHRETYEEIFGPLPALDDTSRFPRLAADETGCPSLNRDNECTALMRGSPGDGAEFDGMAAEDQVAVTLVWVNIGKALGAYQRLLQCGPGRFDQWVAGDEGALTRAEQRGAALFVSKAGCVTCHSGPFMSDEQFHNVGLQPQVVATVFLDLDDPGAAEGVAALQEDPLNSDGPYSDGQDGRIPATIEDNMLGAFRTPRLRCVAERPSFMHTGHMRTLDEVVEFFSRGGDPFGFPGQSELVPLNLGPREVADIVAFLGTLTGPGPDARLLLPPER
jgi:cytochrome c peroxidase